MTNDTTPPPPPPSTEPAEASSTSRGPRPGVTDLEGFDAGETYTDGDPAEVERLWRLSRRAEGS